MGAAAPTDVVRPEGWMCPTQGLRVGGLLVVASGVYALNAEPFGNDFGLACLAASVVLALPAARRRRTPRCWVAFIAVVWMVMGLLLALPGVVLMAGLAALPLGLLGGGIVALTACGVGWGNPDTTEIVRSSRRAR